MQIRQRMTTNGRWPLPRIATLALGLCLAMFTGSMSRADEAADRAQITARLNGFADAFNARNASGACDLFAPDLVATIPLGADTTREKLCGNLARLLSLKDLQLRYDHPEIHEVMVSGDLAVVRLVWTLTAQKGGISDQTQEGGLDVFRRQADGRWSIARMAAFPFRPNKILDE